MSSGLIEVPLGLELVFPGGRVRHDYSQLPAPELSACSPARICR
jgi:hypothetical protein